MAFSTQRGRPRSARPETDFGTPELRLKHAAGITAEPIDLCLERALITKQQHWCGLHLRWLYTLRYGAPVLTTRYADRQSSQEVPQEEDIWREIRQREYHEAVATLKHQRRYESVMRLCIYNELPAFLNARLQQRAWNDPSLAHQLLRTHHMLREGLEILRLHWNRHHANPDKPL